MQKNVEYEKYGGTHQGALGLLDSGKLNKKGKPTKEMRANCADQAHLTVALLRAQNIPAQYKINGYNDSNGTFHGHAWVLAKIPNETEKSKWQSGDPTLQKSRNFGSKTKKIGRVKNYIQIMVIIQKIIIFM